MRKGYNGQIFKNNGGDLQPAVKMAVWYANVHNTVA
jgi:hypothetical protein